MDQFQETAERGPRLFVQISAVLFAIALFSYGFANTHHAKPILAEDPKKESPGPFDELVLTAKSVIVYDTVREKIIYQKNAEIQLPLASIAKLMTAIVAAETIPSGNNVGITADAVTREGDTGLRAGETWNPVSLIRYTLVASSNDGAAALASAANAFKSDTSFVDLMNRKAKTLNMAQTYFLNESGLDVSSGVSGAYGSAKDIAMLLSYALTRHRELFSATTQRVYTAFSLDNKSHTAENTNAIIGRIPSVVASKTGWTDLAGGNLAIVFEAGPAYPIAVVVLNSSYDDRFTDVEKLAWAAIKSLKNSEHLIDF